MPDFFDVVQTQRAARSFGPDDVDDATVAKILTAATHAPSAENSQPFVFIVVRDPALRSAIGGITARVWEGGARALETGRLAPALLDEVDRGARGGVAGAPVLVVVCGDARLTFAPTLGASVFPAVQNLLLAAHALGLGSALTTLARPRRGRALRTAGSAGRGGAAGRGPARAPERATRAAAPPSPGREGPSRPLRGAVPSAP